MVTALRLISTKTRGRALVAARSFVAGERVFRERPLIVADPLSLPPAATEHSPLGERLRARLPLGPLRESCAAEGVRYPLLVAQMLVTSLTASAESTDGPSFEAFWESASALSAPPPVERPARWSLHYELLRESFCDPTAKILGAEQLFAQGALDEDWVTQTLAMLHANLIRVTEREVALLALGSMVNHDCAPNLDFDFFRDSPVSAGAVVPGGASGVAEFCAKRDIREGEELTMAYVSPLAPPPGGSVAPGLRGAVSGRRVPSAEQREQLRTAHGFDCDSCACASRENERWLQGRSQ